MIAIIGYTAAELIYEKVDSNKEHHGLTNWKRSPNVKIMKYDIGIAKNYLNDKEIKKLESLTTLFLDYAEDMANGQNSPSRYRTRKIRVGIENVLDKSAFLCYYIFVHDTCIK